MTDFRRLKASLDAKASYHPGKPIEPLVPVPSRRDLLIERARRSGGKEAAIAAILDYDAAQLQAREDEEDGDE